MQLDLQIRDWLARYLADEVSLEQFVEWFASSAWDAHRSAAPRVQDLVDEIELQLAEYSSGGISPAEFRRRLSALRKGSAVP